MPDKWAQYAQPSTPASTDKWAQYAQPADAAPVANQLTDNPNGEGVYQMTGTDGKTVGIPYSNVRGALTSGYKLNAGDRERYTKDYVAAAPKLPTSDSNFSIGGTLAKIPEKLGDVAKGIGGLFAPPSTPDEAAVGSNLIVGNGALPVYRALKGIGQSVKRSGQQTAQYAKDTAEIPWSAPLPKILSGARTSVAALSTINPMNPGGTAGMNDAIDSGHPDDAVAEGIVQGGLLAAPELKRLGGAGSVAKGVLAGDVTAPMAGSDLTPLQRYTDAKELGVQLPAAQATNSPVLRGVDWLNREGILSAPVYDRLNTKNLNALTDSSQRMLDDYSPYDPETGGTKIQQPLQRHFTDLQDRANDIQGEMSPLEGEAAGLRQKDLAKQKMDQLHKDAGDAYDAVAENYGDTPVNPRLVQKTAAEIASKNENLNTNFPSLASRKLNNIVADAAKLGENGQPNVGNMMRVRSALLDMTRDPEIVKSSQMADIQRLIAAHDQSIMDALPEDGQTQLRGAHEKWETLKNTFDNPSNPYYYAVRDKDPSTLTTGIGESTPQGIRTLRSINGDEGVSIARRGNAQKLLSRTHDGSYDLRGFSGRLEKLPEELRTELFSNPQNMELRRLGSDYREMQPFEAAATTNNPESLVTGKGLGPKTAAGVRTLRELPMKPEGAVGPAAPRIGEEGMGALRRGVATDLLGKTPEGGFNFKRLPTDLKNMNEGYMSELFGPDDTRLQKIANTSKALDVDYNRSGSGKLAQKVIEAGKMMTGAPLVQYPIAKLMTSPKFTDWLMRPSELPVSRAPGVSGAVLADSALAARRRHVR